MRFLERDVKFSVNYGFIRRSSASLRISGNMLCRKSIRGKKADFDQCRPGPRFRRLKRCAIVFSTLL